MALFPMRFKHKKKKKKFKNMAVGILVIPTAIFLSIATLWWASDDFWILSHLLLLDNNIPLIGEQGARRGVKEGETSDGGLRYNGSGASGGGGLNSSILTGQSLGYVIDYLDILWGHCNWTYMNQEVKYADTPLPLHVMLGISSSETSGVAMKREGSGESLIVPATAIDPARYNEVEGLNFYTANSLWFAENGLDYITAACTNKGMMQWGTAASDGGGSAHTTPLQFDKYWFSLFPAQPTGGAESNYPSLLNTGYKLVEDEVRDKTKNDSAYLPDIFSTLIQSSTRRFIQYTDLSRLKDVGMALGGTHVGHHGNVSMMDVAAGCKAGVNASQIVDDNSNSNLKRASAGAWNMYTDMMYEVLDYFTADENVEDLKALAGDPTMGAGVLTGYCLKKYNGFFLLANEQKKCIEKCEQYKLGRGIIIGYSIASGKQASKEEVMNFLASPSRLKTDLGVGYPKGLTGRYHSDSTYWYNIGFFDTKENVVYRDGNGQSVPAIHIWNRITANFVIKDQLNGIYQYWNCLKGAGVDCTLQEVIDKGAALLDEIPRPIKQTQSNNLKGLDAFYRGHTIYDATGEPVEEALIALDRDLTIEALGKYEPHGGVSGEGSIFEETIGSQSLLDRFWKVVKETGCPYHKPAGWQKYKNQDEYPNANNGDGDYLQCPWWSRGRAREYLSLIHPEWLIYGTARGHGGTIAGNWVNAGFKETKGNIKGPSIISYAGGSYGHTAFVEAVCKDGSFYVSDAGTGYQWFGVRKKAKGTSAANVAYLDERTK